MTIRRQDRIALGGVVALGLVVAFYVLVLSPVRHHAARLSQEVGAQRQALVAAEDQYAAGRAAQGSLKGTSADMAALARAVPQASDIPALLRLLERNAAAVGVDMQAIALTGSSDDSSDSSGTSATPSAAGATTVPLSLTFAGGYQRLDRLVKRLDGLVVVSDSRVRASGPLLAISNVSITKTPALTVQLTATLYQQSARSAATQATAEGSS